ncbi:MAG: HAD family hydrolase [Chromatiales bacterium]|nr:HAD family hydrolase [Chromatiales bacterium]
MIEGLRLLTIDLDDTLWPCWPTIEAAEQSLKRWIGQHAPRAAHDYDPLAMRTGRRLIVRDCPHLAHDLTALRLEALTRLFAAHGYDAELASAASEHFVNERQKVDPYPEVIDTLRALRRHVVLASVTNGNAAIERTPLAGLFELSLTAAEVGAMRPDPALFNAALTHFGVSPDEAAHVGDDPVLDVGAARAVGMRAIWLDRFGRDWPAEHIAPDARVTTLADLLP